MKKHFSLLIIIGLNLTASQVSANPQSERSSLVEAIHQQYQAGPRIRFDALLDGSCQQNYKCQSDRDGNSNESVCNMIRYGSMQSKALVSAKEYCRCQTEAKYECNCNFPENNCAERQLIEASITASNFISEVAKKRGYNFNVTPIELYLLFLMEGAFFPVAVNQTCEIDGFGFLGLDTLMSGSGDIQKKYQPWSHPDLLAFIKSNGKEHRFTNEQNKPVYSISNFDLKSGVYAFAAMYGYYKSFANDRLQAVDKTAIATLPRQGQIFWAYLHFNSGEDNGIPLKIELYKQPWSAGDNFGKNRMSTVYNSLVRVSTYVYTRERCRRGDPVSSQLCSTVD
jgi:hypothetical protein